MTIVMIVAPITTLRGGKMTLVGDYDTSKLTVNDVKVLILEQLKQEKMRCKQLSSSDLTMEQLRIWWKGYLLDDNDLTMERACVGVTLEERIQPSSEDNLVLFLVEYFEECSSASANRLRSSSTATTEDVTVASRLSLRQFRSNSFDLRVIQNEIRQKKVELQMRFCTIL